MRAIAYVFLLFALLTSCTKKGDFSTSACTQGNSNCELPSMQVEIVGSDNSAQTSVGNNGALGSIEIKSVRFGEKILIEFVLQNPKLVPLKEMIFSMSPGDAAFTVVPSTGNKDCGSGDLLLLYSQKCSVMIDYKPGRIPPLVQALDFRFKTLSGNDFIFSAQFDPAKLLADFYIADNYLTFPETLTYIPGAVSGTEVEIPIENTGTENDLENIQMLLNGSSDWSLQTASSNACTQGQTLTKRGGVCKIKIKFTPTSVGVKYASLVLVSGGNASREYSLSGLVKSVQPDIDSFDFGAALLGSGTVSKTLTLSIPSTTENASASSCVYSLTGDAAIAVSSNPCLATQTSGSSCAVDFIWTPSNQITEHVSRFSWSCDSRGGAGSVVLTAKSVISPLITDFTQVNFVDTLVGSSVTQSIKFKNLGTLGTLSNFNRVLTGTSFTETATTCTDTISGSAECNYAIRFSPLTSGPFVGTVAGTSVPSNMDYNVVLDGNGISVTASSGLVDFGLVGIGNDRPGTTIVISNPSTTETATGCTLSYTSALAQNFSIDSDSTCINKPSLASGETCTVKPRFTPALPEGDRSASVSLQCTVGGTALVTLEGYSAIETRLVVAPPSHLTANDHLVGTTNYVEFLLMNEHATETATTISVTTPGIEFGWSTVAASSNDCSGVTNLAPGESCRVRLRSSPSATPGTEQVGSFTGQLSVSADNGNIDPPDGSYSSNNKKIISDYTTYDFGSRNINTIASSLPISISNPSTLDSATGCSLAVSAGFEILSTTCGGAGLLPLSSCNVRLRVPAVATPQILTGNLDYTCSVGGRARTPLTISITPLPNFAWSGNEDFGYLDTAAAAVQRTYTLTNSDPQSITLTAVDLTGGDASYSVVSQTCSVGTTLVPAASCNMVVSFDSSDESAHYATIEAYGRRTGSSDTPQLSSLGLTGTGSHMTLALSSSSLTFSDKELGSLTTENKTITLTNNGTRPANLTYSSLSAPFSNTTTGTCSTTLNAGASCTVILQMAPASTVGTSSATFNFIETSQGVSTQTPVTISGVTLAQAVLAVKDDITNTSYVATIAQTDITGAVGSALNITDRIPASKTVIYTIRNNMSDATSVTLGTAQFTRKSGTNGTMSLTNNTCDGATLAALGTCAMTVTYTPSADRDTSTYGLSLSGTSGFGTTLSVAVTDIVGSSYKSATLVLSSGSIDFGVKVKGSTNLQELTLQNTGDYTATLVSFPLTGTGSTHFSKQAGTSGTDCAATLAAGSTCYFKIQFLPTAVVAAATTETINYSYLVGASTIAKSTTAAISGASYVQLTSTGFGAVDSGKEPEITADATRAYVSSVHTDGTTYAQPVITICDLASGGYVDSNTASCTQNILKDGATTNFLAGSFGGASPKIAVTTNHIFLSVNNQDVAYSGDTSNGSSTIIVCNKPGVGTRVISFATDCYVDPLHTTGNRAGSGTFPSMQIVGNKIALSNAISNGTVKGFLLTVCTFDDSSNVLATVVNNGSCKDYAQDLSFTERSQMGQLSFNGSKFVYSAYNRRAGEESLNAVLCDIDSSTNTFTCGTYGVVDNTPMETTLYPGAYPSVILDSSHFYIAAQQGETTFHYLKLSDCTVGASNTFTCLNQTVATSGASVGLGMVPRISMSGSGTGARIWLSYLGASSDTIWSGVYSEVRYCTVQSGVQQPSCPSSPHFTAPITISYQLSSRGHYLDTANNVMLIPQTTWTTRKVGIVSVGLTPEI